MKSGFALFFALALLLFLSSIIIIEVNGEVDEIGVVTKIVDGDTFDIIATNGTEFRIRLADVDANESGEVGYAEAKEYLRGLIFGKTVYLDVDDLYVWDYEGKGDRLVCVTYVDYNSTHWENVNEALVGGGYAEVDNYLNEFNPYSWVLYVPLPTPSPSPSPSPTPTPTPTPAPTASPTPTPTSTPTPTAVPTPTPTPSPSPSQSPSPSDWPTPSPEPTITPTTILPPEAFYAATIIGVAAIVAVTIVVLKKQKK